MQSQNTSKQSKLFSTIIILVGLIIFILAVYIFKNQFAKIRCSCGCRRIIFNDHFTY